MTRKRAKKLTPTEKQQIASSYDKGLPPRVIADVLGKSVEQIKTFFSRFRRIRDMPPKTEVS